MCGAGDCQRRYARRFAIAVLPEVSRTFAISIRFLPGMLGRAVLTAYLLSASIFTPIMPVVGVMAARGHNVRRHKITMISIFAGALVVAGLFTLVPGRIMHTVIFGH